MHRHIRWWVLSVLTLCGCSGSSTGNPAEENEVVAPKGAELAMSDAPREADTGVSAAEIKTLAEGNRAFAFDLYAELAKVNENLFFSPYSISVALAMTYAGAQNNTETQMRDTLHFSLEEPKLHAAFDAAGRELKIRAEQIEPDVEGDGFQLSIVNQAWGQKGYSFLDSYLDVLAIYYGAGLFLVDFAQAEPTRRLINDWVAEQTEQRIKDLLPAGSISDLTTLVLTNAIYFKASWLKAFDPANTADGVFHAPSADRTVPMMRQAVDGRYAEGTDYQAVELPYVSPSVRMLIVLPASVKFDAVAGGLNEAFFQQLQADLKDQAMSLTMPRFSFQCANRLKTALEALGMPDAFSDAADFSGIDGTRGLYIDQVYHKAFISVDEKGTEAAAATAVVINWRGAPSTVEVILDRAFIFFIYDQPTGQILFAGHVQDPTL